MGLTYSDVTLFNSVDVGMARRWAMKLRTLQTIDGLGAGNSNTVVMFPIELVEALNRLTEAMKTKQ